MKTFTGILWTIALVALCVPTVLFFKPAFNEYLRSEKRTQAKNEVLQIATAVTAFQTEYGRFPSTNGEVQDVGGRTLQALMGLDPSLNPRKLVFLDARPQRWWRPLRGGLKDGVYVDPWGSPYKMKLDTDGDKRITEVGTAATGTVMRPAAVWNDPSTHADKESEMPKRRRQVTSWD